MLLTTDSVHPADRVAYWQEVVCETFVALDCRSPLRGEFCGTVQSHVTGGLRLTRVDANAHSVARTGSLIARSRDDVLLLSLGSRGGGQVRQDGREAKLSPGSFTLYDTTRPYELRFAAPFMHWVLAIPREAMRRRLGVPEDATARVPSGALGRLAHSFLSEFVALPDTLPRATQDRLADQALDLVAMALAEQGGAADQRPHGTYQTLLLVRIRAFVEQHLHRPELDAVAIAAVLRVSPRSVRALFAAEGGTAGRYIMRRRLDRARNMLADPTLQGRTVSEIAFAVGFTDLPHFSRSFRLAYSCSPRQFRAGNIAGSPTGSTPAD